MELLVETGKVSSCDFGHIKIMTQLIYKNGFPAPIMPLKPLKKKAGKMDQSNRSRKLIFVHANGEPVLRQGENSSDFVFLLEEVSYHHGGHDVFRVRVFLKGGFHALTVHPAVSKEVITNLSKQKKV